MYTVCIVIYTGTASECKLDNGREKVVWGYARVAAVQRKVHLYIYICIFTYIYMCVCVYIYVYMCVCILYMYLDRSTSKCKLDYG